MELVQGRATAESESVVQEAIAPLPGDDNAYSDTPGQGVFCASKPIAPLFNHLELDSRHLFFGRFHPTGLATTPFKGTFS